MPASLSALAPSAACLRAQQQFCSSKDCVCPPQQPIHTINPTTTTLTTLNSPRSPSEPPFDRTLTHTPSTPSQYVRVNQCPRSSANHVFSSSTIESPLSIVFPHHVPINHSSLASHYGIPTILPKPPSTLPRNKQPLKTSPFPDFDLILKNYLSMISKAPSSNPSDDMIIDKMTAPPSSFTSDSTSPMFSDFGDDFLTSPHNDFLTSPIFDSYGDFSDSSPLETPLDSFLTTPIFQDVHEPLIAGEDDYSPMNLFGGHDFSLSLQPEQKLPSLPHSIDPSSLSCKVFQPELSATPEPSSPAPVTKPARKPRKPSAVTGTRKNISPETMVPLDAPTQTRKYVTPSATSRKEIPVTFLKKKRSRSQAFGSEEDQLEEVCPPNATEAEQIEFKRRQNTLAARKSRKRKLAYQQGLESHIEDLQAQLSHWKARAEVCEEFMKEKGLSVPSS